MTDDKHGGQDRPDGAPGGWPGGDPAAWPGGVLPLDREHMALPGDGFPEPPPLPAHMPAPTGEAAVVHRALLAATGPNGTTIGSVENQFWSDGKLDLYKRGLAQLVRDGLALEHVPDDGCAYFGVRALGERHWRRL